MLLHHFSQYENMFKNKNLFLVFIFTNKGLNMKKNPMQTIVNLRRWEFVCEIQSFFGFDNVYWRFLKEN